MNNDKYDLHDTAYGVQGWDAILEADMQIINDMIPTRTLGTLGEEVLAYQALFVNPDDYYFYLAQADGTKQPCIGLAVEGGILDEEIRIHQMGVIQNENWAWIPGLPVYLDESTPGELTQTPPTTNKQLIGIALTDTDLFVMIQPPNVFSLPTALLGETVLAHQALYLSDIDEYWYLAQADGTKQPCLGFASKDGELDDEVPLIHSGVIEDGTWSWTPGLPVCLSEDTAGELTQTPPTAHKQLIGYAISATKLLLMIQAVVTVELPVYASNADALVGGLSVGDYYRTGEDPDHVCVVHGGS